MLPSKLLTIRTYIILLLLLTNYKCIRVAQNPIHIKIRRCIIAQTQVVPTCLRTRRESRSHTRYDVHEDNLESKKGRRKNKLEETICSSTLGIDY